MLAAPLTLLGLMFFVGLILLWRGKAIGQRLLVSTAVLFLIFGFLPVGANLLAYLETRYPVIRPADLPGRIDGMIILGGFIDTDQSARSDQIHLNDNAERLSEALILARRHPDAKILFSGGSGSLSSQDLKETIYIKRLLRRLDMRNNFMFESESRNTYENALNSHAIVQPQKDEVWILVTSAFHMKRAKAVFDNQNWTVIPYPAGLISSGKPVLIPSFDVIGNFHKLNVAVREIIGIIAYTLTGKI